jgi:DNA-3-methyladenine glycosylase I
MLTLEGAQAGLSWLTILRKRKGYRKAFVQFDPRKVARFTKRDVTRLLKDEGIVRNRLKIESTVSNARAFLAVQKEFGSFDAYVWSFVDGRQIVRRPRSMRDIKPTTRASDALSADLKQRGFRFVGSTIIYAYMQAAGLVDDHVTSCFRKQKRQPRTPAGRRTTRRSREEILKELQQAPAVGPSIARSLYRLGIRSFDDLRVADPEKMYERDCRLEGGHVDRCVLYTYRCVVYFSRTSRPDPQLLLWWNWKDKKLPARRTKR